MRRGLATVGTALIVLGTATAAAAGLLPPATNSSGYTYQLSLYSAGNQTRSALVPGDGGPAATLTVNWTATAVFDVALYPAGNCTVAAPACAAGPALLHWPGNVSGSATVHGDLHYPYLLVWTEESGPGGLLQISCDSRATSTTPLAGLLLVTIYVSAAVLGALGILALFLGLFLRAGYRERLRPPPNPPAGPPPGDAH